MLYSHPLSCPSLTPCHVIFSSLVMPQSHPLSCYILIPCHVPVSPLVMLYSHPLSCPSLTPRHVIFSSLVMPQSHPLSCYILIPCHIVIPVSCPIVTPVMLHSHPCHVPFSPLSCYIVIPVSSVMLHSHPCPCVSRQVRRRRVGGSSCYAAGSRWSGCVRAARVSCPPTPPSRACAA